MVEALLAHKQHGVAAVYNRASFREAKRSALIRWHDIVQRIVKSDGAAMARPTTAKADDPRDREVFKRNLDTPRMRHPWATNPLVVGTGKLVQS